MYLMYVQYIYIYLYIYIYTYWVRPPSNSGILSGLGWDRQAKKIE